MITIPLNLTLHEKQKTWHNAGKRFRVIKAGKRTGKSKWACFELVQKAAESRGRYWYIAPTYGQAEDIAWRDLTVCQDDGPAIIPQVLIKNTWQTKLMIELINGSIITLKGADNPNTLRGAGLNGVIFDERSYQDEPIWDAIIRGQLAKSKGFAYFISSPWDRGRNHYTTFCDEAKRKMLSGDPDWFYDHCTIWDNPMLDPKEIQAMKDNMSDDKWNLEYMAEESAVGGLRFSEFSRAKNVLDMDQAA